jgi:hypothetical protein
MAFLYYRHNTSMNHRIYLCCLFIIGCLFVASCTHTYPATYDPDSMLIDPKNPNTAHLYDIYGRYMATGQFVDSCSNKPILSQSSEELAKCRFKTDVSIYPSGIAAMQHKVAKARAVSGSVTTSPPALSPGIANNSFSGSSSSKGNADYALPQKPTLSFTPSPTSPRRVALIIGNSLYHNLPRLDNPSNDAKLIAKTLTEVGFELVKGKALLDLDRMGLEEAVKAFSHELHRGKAQIPAHTSTGSLGTSIHEDHQGGLVALFYYAGHGLQVRGENYLVPTDANPTRESDLDFQLMNVNVVLRQMEDATTSLNIVILDACRNNPMGGRGLRSGSNGLAEMQAPEGTLIAFATQSGNVALDGQPGGNSPFAQSLAWGIKQPGLDQFGAFNAVAVHVKKMTKGEQQPWMSNSPIEGQFFFVDR